MSFCLAAMASLRGRGKFFVLLLVLVIMSHFREGEGATTCLGKLSTFATYAGKNSVGSDYSHFNSTLDRQNTLTSCKTTCAKNCSCVAFSLETYNDGSNYTCWFKYSLVSTSNLTLTTTEDLYVRQKTSSSPSPPPPPSTISPPPPSPPPPPSGLCERLDDYTKYNNTRLPGYDIQQLYLSGTVDKTLDQCKELCTADCDCVAFNLVAGYYGDSVCSKKYYVSNSSFWQTYEDYDLYVRSVGGSTCVGEGKTDQYQEAILETDSAGYDLPFFCSSSPIVNYARTQCQELCSANCSCVGFVFSSSMRCCFRKYFIVSEADRVTLANNELYIRINTSPPPPPLPPPSPLPSQPADNNISSGLLVGIVTGSSAIVICLLALLGGCYFQCYRRKRDDIGGKRVVNRIALSNIATATKNFSRENILGEGGYGTVYVGVKEDGEKWAVKRAINASIVSLQNFKQEVDIISQMSHTNIVQLLGYCDEGTEQILVYEFMEKGSLKKLLHDGEGESLTFEQRVEIAIDVAEGLRYLHHYAGATVIHRDIKTDNILVDSKFKGKIADFGLLKDNPLTVINVSDQVEIVGTQGNIKMISGNHNNFHGKTKIAGTPGYIDPAYLKTSQVSTKSDVYSFGVVLFELITGRRALVRDDSAPEDDPSLDTLVHWIQPHLKNIESIVDPQLGGMYHKDALRKLTRLAIICTEKDPKTRPTMEEVSQLLVQIRNILLDKQAIDLDDIDERESADDSPNLFPVISGSSDSTLNFNVPISETIGPR